MGANAVEFIESPVCMPPYCPRKEVRLVRLFPGEQCNESTSHYLPSKLLHGSLTLKYGTSD